MKEAYLTGAREKFRHSKTLAVQQGPCLDEFSDLVHDMIEELRRMDDVHEKITDQYTTALKDNDRLKAENQILRQENERLKAGK